LTKLKRKRGLKSLLNGRDLESLVEIKTDYYYGKQEIVAAPKRGTWNLFTAVEYSEFSISGFDLN